jgi:hypothetical protein
MPEPDNPNPSKH